MDWNEIIIDRLVSAIYSTSAEKMDKAVRLAEEHKEVKKELKAINQRKMQLIAELKRK